MNVKRTALLVIGMLLVPLFADAKSWPEAKKEFKTKYASPDFAVKAEGVRALADGNNKQACVMLAGVVRKHDVEINKALKALEDRKEKLKPYLGRTTFSKGELSTKQRLEAEIKELEKTWKGHEDICDAATWALGEMKSEEAQKWLLKGLKMKPWRMQVVVARALGRLGGPYAVKALTKGLRGKNPRVVAACCDGLALAKARSASTSITSLVKHRVWQVRAAAARALGVLGAIDAIPALIDQLDKERGRVQTDINNALVKLTGVDHRDNAQMWRMWYGANKAKVEKRAGKPLEDGEVEQIKAKDDGGSVSTTFYGIKTRSKAIVFVIDRSGSMETMADGQKGEDAKPAEKKPPVTLTGEGKGDEIRKAAEEAIEEIKGGRKIDVAKRELIRAVSALPDTASFTIIWYNEGVQPWKKQMMRADNETKKKAIEEIKKLEPLGATNIFDSVEQAFKLAGFGKAEENYLKGADTIFLLSDGAPNHGRFTAWDDIHREVKKMNTDRRITIHTIGIGQMHNSADMEQLAQENGGKYVARN